MVKKCIRCGQKAGFQWQICSDGNNYRPLCIDCDIELNETVLLFMGHPRARELSAKYAKEKKAEVVNNKSQKRSKPKRKGLKIKRGIRISVFEKTGGLCTYCHTNLQIDRPGAEDYMTVDHVIPTANGGKNHIDNMAPSCKKCNEEKDNLDLDVFLKQRKRITTSRW
jgi:5-methylcytosine-specific restriction endonuclease McrA